MRNARPLLRRLAIGMLCIAAIEASQASEAHAAPSAAALSGAAALSTPPAPAPRRTTAPQRTAATAPKVVPLAPAPPVNEPRSAMPTASVSSAPKPNVVPEGESAPPARAMRDQDPMEALGIGLKLGIAGMARGALSGRSNGRSLVRDIDPRRGLHVALPIHFGGSGFGFTVEPYLSRSRLEHGVRDAEGTIVGREETSLTALGAYMGIALNIHVSTPVYLGIGLGVKGAYIATDGFDYALDAYGRLPLSATYYVADQCGLVVELGLGYGLSLFADRPRLRFDPLTGIPRNVPESPQIGTAFAWDLSFGVRLP